MENFKKIFNVLDLTKENGLFILSEDEWQVQCKFSKRVEHLIKDVLNPYAFFYFNETPFIFFFDNPNNLEQLHQQIWNFNQTPVVFIRFDNQNHIYNGFSFIKDKGKKELAILADFDKDLNDFNYFEIVTGETWEKYQQKLQGKQRVDYQLLNNIKTLRNQLTATTGDFAKIANSLIGRILFIRYLIDRKVRIQNRLWTNEDLCKVLESVETTYELFEYLQSKDNYNGDLFPLEESERSIVNEIHLQKIIQLLKGTDLEKGQLSLFDIYDFSIIPVELISNVYEFFIGTDNQQLSGAYYTPLFLVNYVLNQTVGKYFKDNPQQYDCKVLDPSCGSGIFLVESLRKIIWRYKALNKGCEKDIKLYHKQLKKLLKENIFGIDIDGNAINVAIFSLYITLLDFIDKPADIESFKFPNVLNENFFVADFFDENKTYNQILKEKKLNFIIGNPPWGVVPDNEGNFLYENYWRRREKVETQLVKERTKNKKSKVKIAIARKEIAQAFLIRTNDFSSLNTKCGLIVTSKVLYNLYAIDFRKYFLNNNKISQILELSSVRFDVFDKSNDPAIAPASIIFYSPSKAKKDILDNVINHISLKPNRFFTLFKLFVIEKYDLKKIPQNLFLSYDWLWKTLVYGNVLDFIFIKRINGNYESIDQIISDRDRFLKNTGIKYKDGSNKFETSDLIGEDYVKSNRDLQPFFINTLDKWGRKEVGYLPDKRIFEPPVLLIRKRVSKKLTGISAVELNRKKIFTCSITGFKALNRNDENVLENISAIFNSNLLAYYLLQTNTSVGIERGDVYLKEIIQMPFVFSEDIISSYKAISVNELKLAKSRLANFEQQNLINNKEKLLYSLNQKIYEAFQLSNQERDIIDYALEVSIPAVQEKENYNYLSTIELNEKGKDYLKQYGKIIASHFNHLFQKANKKIQINIYYSKYTIGVEFCVIDKSDTKSEFNFITDKDSIAMLKKFALLSYEKLSEELFIQKDIKGFEKESFYVIKPNEYKCWHRAIGHLDLGEILQATLKAGAKQKRSKHYAQ